MEALDLAKSELEIAIEVAETNIPINEAEGNLAQAQLERKVAAQCRTAVELIDRELETMNREMTDKTSDYWKSDKKQARYRELVEKKNTLLA